MLLNGPRLRTDILYMYKLLLPMSVTIKNRYICVPPRTRKQAKLKLQILASLFPPENVFSVCQIDPM